MARAQAATAVSGGRRALLLLRPRGADGALPPAAAAPAAASPDPRALPSPARRCLGDWQRPAAPPARGVAMNGGTGWESRRCGQRDVCISASSSLQSKGNVSLLGNRKLFFDTHALVCLLEENGFTTRQSEVIVSALVKIMNTNLDVIYMDMVTKVQQEIALQQVMSHIGGVKKDMIILEKSEFSALRSENEKIKLELQQIKKHVMDEITKVRADNKLNLNLEKSRVKELYSLNERKLLEMRTEIVELHAQQDRALTQTDRKIDTEVADLKTMLESHKLDNIKYLAGSIFTCLTVALGFYRLWI
ncbi:mitochondrial calcium uniporter regulator 1 [Podargus strigoides]